MKSPHGDEVLDPQPVRAGLIGVVSGGAAGERALPLPLVHGGRRTCIVQCIVHTCKLGLQLYVLEAAALCVLEAAALCVLEAAAMCVQAASLPVTSTCMDV